MSSSSSNDDEEPKVCTVFASAPTSGSSKSVFDTIAFTMPKKDKETSTPTTPSVDPIFGTETETGTAGRYLEDIFSASEQPVTSRSTAASGLFEDSVSVSKDRPIDIFEEARAAEGIREDMVGLTISDTDPSESVTEQQSVGFSASVEAPTQGISSEFEEQTFQMDGQESFNPALVIDAGSPILTANRLFANAPETPFPVGIGEVTSMDASFHTTPSTEFPQGSQNFDPTAFTLPPFSGGVGQQSIPISLPTTMGDTTPFSAGSVQAQVFHPASISKYNEPVFTTTDLIHDAWIPKPETKRILASIAAASQSGTGTYFPDKSHMTTPGIVYEDDLIDKVGVNMSRIFGEAEASKRKILTADNVPQDDNGLRDLIKLGCYRSAINLTKRMLTLYGQGPGRVGQFSKHNPHTLQLWFTRIALLMRIREFTIAESETDAFKEFENPDLYYEYYPDSYGKGRKGSMVPFHFRVLVADIPQYLKKHNETIDRLHRIRSTVEKIIGNIENGLAEDGNLEEITPERKTESLEIWRKREIRVYYSLANASLFAKDYRNTFKFMTILCEKDKGQEPQLKSAIGRFFLQLGDLTMANTYFQSATDLRKANSDVEQVDNLIDSAMITIGQGAYPEAYAVLQQALLIQPDNFLITNNMAVCLLYMGKVKDALVLMESTVKNNTPELLQENVLLNLSTIYELENTDGHKKNALLKLISEYKGDGINLASLKMPNLI